MRLLGIDIGTTTICRTLLGSAVDSQSMPTGGTGEIFDPADILARCESMAQGKYDAIGVTGQMHGILYIDAAGNAVSPLYTWKFSKADCADELLEKSGYKLPSGYGALTHFYNIKNGNIPREAKYLCTIGDYIAMHLSGRTVPVIHPTNAGGIGIYNLSEGDFDRAALDAAGMRPEMFPSVGTVLSDSVAAAIGDNQAAVFACLGKDDGAVINIGTGGQASEVSSEIISGKNIECRPYFGGKYLLVGASLCGGRAYAMLKDLFAPFCPDTYSMLENAALSFTGEAPTVITAFSGTRADPSATGSITGITADNLCIGGLAKGFLEGCVAELAGYLSEMPAPSRIMGSGGGFRRSTVMRNAALKRWPDMQFCPYKEEASAGAALFAGECFGIKQS